MGHRSFMVYHLDLLRFHEVLRSEGRAREADEALSRWTTQRIGRRCFVFYGKKCRRGSAVWRSGRVARRARQDRMINGRSPDGAERNSGIDLEGICSTPDYANAPSRL